MGHPVTLSSDFGPQYPGAMRGVLARRGIDRVIDLTHELPPHDIRQAAFWVEFLLPYQPRGVHCVVVDPGVGGDRAVAIFRAGGHAIVCPDNGVGWPAALSLARGTPVEAFAFEHVPPQSETFHGRDVFAPVAAAVATVGIDRVTELPTVHPHDDPAMIELPEATVGDGWIETEVIASDRFGNAITSATGEHLPAVETVCVDGSTVPLVRRYGSVTPGTAIVTVGSHGNIELAANQASGTDAHGVSVGDLVRISWS